MEIRHRAGSRSAAVLVALVALAATGCGSTVQVGSQDAASYAAAGDALGQPGTIDPLTGLPAGTTVGPDGEPVDGALGSTVGGGPGSSGTTGSTSGPTAGATTPAGTPAAPTTPLKLGVIYNSQTESTATSLGIDGLSPGDTRAQATALAAHLNSEGGVGGRKVQLFFADLNNSGGTPHQVAMETACRQLTEDDDVDVVTTAYSLGDSSMTCFAKAGVGVVSDLSALNDAQMARYRDVFAAPGDFAVGRMTAQMVDSLWDRGWLTEDSVVGAFSYDDGASVEAVEKFLQPALAKHGLDIAEYQRISNDANGVAQSGNVVLQFRSSGVDRIIPVGASPLFVMQSASSQGYRPDWALNSFFGPGALLEGTAPRDQLQGSAGIGWQPWLDIGRGQRPALGPNEALCFSILQEAGQSSTSTTTKGIQLVLCNAFFYLAHAAEKVGSAPTNLIQLANSRVGASFSPADTFRSDVSRHADGAAAYRELTYTDGCTCFQYGAQRDTTS